MQTVVILVSIRKDHLFSDAIYKSFIYPLIEDFNKPSQPWAVVSGFFFSKTATVHIKIILALCCRFALHSHAKQILRDFSKNCKWKLLKRGHLRRNPSCGLSSLADFNPIRSRQLLAWYMLECFLIHPRHSYISYTFIKSFLCVWSFGVFIFFLYFCWFIYFCQHFMCGWGGGRDRGEST